jgi:signal transduction histidine kinase
LFERFFSTKPNGMGMGLAISRSLIEEHGGSIWVESQLGTGTTFFVSLPLVPLADRSLPALGSNA